MVSSKIVEGRSELGRKLTMERFYKREEKKTWVTYFWFLMLGGLAAHRFYLRKWKSAMCLLVIIWIPNLLLLYFTTPEGPRADPFVGSYNTAAELIVLIPWLWLGIIIVEVIAIPFLTTSANRELKHRLSSKFGFDNRLSDELD